MFRPTNLSVVKFLLSAALGSFSGDTTPVELLKDFLRGDYLLKSPEALRGGRLAASLRFSLLFLSDDASSTLS